MKPNPDIALIYHYDLARALAGEVVDWQAIPVNVQAGREGGDLCRAAADFGKRRDLFAMPAPQLAPTVTFPVVEQQATERSAVPAGAGSVADLAVPVSPVTVEQPAVDPRPDTASPPVAVSAADPILLEPTGGHIDTKRGRVYEYREVDRNRLIARVKALVDAGHIKLVRLWWPLEVPTLKHEGHTPEQLDLILAAVRKVEAEVGAGWHPDDSPEPHSAKAIRRAVDAWAGRDPGTAWFAASLIATFEQCRNADATFEQLVASFTIEQADRLHDAAQAAQ